MVETSNVIAVESWCVVIVPGVCCDRCPGATMANSSRFARRRLLKAAIFQPQPIPRSQAAVDGPSSPELPADAVAPRLATSAHGRPYRAVTGEIIDVSPHVVTIGSAAGERRYTLTADATAWRGSTLEPAALSLGDEAVVRLVPSQPGVADRIWANIGRVTGTIVERHSDSVLVAEGSTRRQQKVVITPRASGRIQVKFPNLRPGYLIDVIGIRRDGFLEGLIPAAYQPPYRSDLVPAQQPGVGRVPEAMAGSAIWHDAADEPYGVLGVFYPAVDPATGCAEDAEAGFAPGQAPAYRSLPYLAIGSALGVRNECTGISLTLPVTGCAPTARLFNDRCVAGRISPRGRIADLTLASFVALGGELDAGCFNSTLTIGR